MKNICGITYLKKKTYLQWKKYTLNFTLFIQTIFIQRNSSY